MSLSRRLFIPKAGQAHGRYAAFRLNGTLNYRGDTVFIDTTAPASQGASGVLAGETLSSSDFLYVTSASVANEATIGQGAVAGVIEGLKVGDRNTTTLLPDDGVVIVQVAGVFRDHAWMSATTGVAQWLALADSANTLGSARPIVGVGVTTLGGAQLSYLVGVIMTTNSATQTRGTVTTANGVTLWVRCGDVV